MKHGVGGLVRGRRVLATLALAAVAMTGCGGSSKAKEIATDKDKPQKEQAAAGSSTTTSTTQAGKKQSGSTAPGSAGDATTTTTTTAPSSAQVKEAAKGDPNAPRLSVPDTLPNNDKKLEIRAELAEACVRPGATQKITIHAKHGSGVVYNTYYADGKHGLSEGYPGGNAGGYTDENGTWSDSWVLKPNAAPGKADIAVLGRYDEHEWGETRVSFVVADATGLCG